MNWDNGIMISQLKTKQITHRDNWRIMKHQVVELAGILSNVE